MYIVLTTFPAHASGNVGDKLITHSAIEILRQEKHENDFEVFFREEDLSDKLDLINQSRAVIMPGFAIRDHMYPEIYRLTSNLKDIKVPLVPMGAGWKGFPGDYTQLSEHQYPQKTIRFINEAASQNTYFACRDYYTQQIVRRHGIENSILVGDCAWYDLNSLGKTMRKPTSIRKLVFTTGHYPLYAPQAIEVLNMLTQLFPEAKKYCSVHGYSNHETVTNHAKELGFEIKLVSHDLENITFYENCDLHVGYRLHGHIAFLRKRIPSILINEDGRGCGFSYTMGVGGFNAFAKTLDLKPEYLSIRTSAKDLAKSVRNRLFRAGIEDRVRNPSEREFVPRIIADQNVPDTIRAFLIEELDSGFQRYCKVGEFIDHTYETAMKSFLNTIP